MPLTIDRATRPSRGCYFELVELYPRFCEVRSGLLGDLNTATTAYARAVSDLSKRAEMMLDSQYVQGRAQVEHAKLDAERCREAYLQHRREHGCLSFQGRRLGELPVFLSRPALAYCARGGSLAPFATFR